MLIVANIVVVLLAVWQLVDTIKFVKLLYSLKEFFDEQGETQ